jgi:tetratricopeptide (TPR) repeat protein
LRVACLAIVWLLVPSLTFAQRQWIEVKSPHFTVVTDSGEKTARNIAWQFEQVREVIKTICPWAPGDIPKPFLVLVPRDENGMKALLPQYADRWNGAHYTGFAQGGVDREYMALRANVNVKREAFAARPWSPAETAATLAQFHAATERPGEARARLAEARKTNANLPQIYEAEAELLTAEKKPEEAKLAYAKAVELGSTNYYAHYMFGNLNRANADAEMLAKVEKSLDTSAKLNPNFVWSHLLLGEVRTQMGRAEDAVVPLERAVTLERDSVRNRVSLARAYYAVNRRDEAQKLAQEALAMASTDADRRSAQQLLDMIQRGTPPARRF